MNKKSFTLIELLIVITIIGILAVALVPRITQGPARARDTKRKADLQNIVAAAELYYADHGIYPGTDPETLIPAADCIGSGNDLDTKLAPYLQGNKVPDDSGSGYNMGNCDDGYFSQVMAANPNSNTRSAFMVVANLENDSALGEGIYCGLHEAAPSAWTDLETTADDLKATFSCDENEENRNAFYVFMR